VPRDGVPVLLWCVHDGRRSCLMCVASLNWLMQHWMGSMSQVRLGDAFVLNSTVSTAAAVRGSSGRRH
jgi:hypothetical protein